MIIHDKIYSKKDLHRQLSEMGAPRNSVVLMHSSLRSVGAVEGGAKGLLDALIEYFTADGGLFCVPTHTWMNLKKEITLDFSDPKTCLGAFSDLAAADSRGIRSENPTHSMVVFGDRERALDFVKCEETVTTCTSADSCYGELYRRGGFVLLVGVAHNRNTYLHSVDELLGVPDRMSEKVRRLTVKRITGEVVNREIRMHETSYTDDISLRFPKYETSFRYHGAIRDGYVGNAPTQLCDARIMKDVMELIFVNSNGVDPLKGEEPIPPSLYCHR